MAGKFTAILITLIVFMACLLMTQYSARGNPIDSSWLPIGPSNEFIYTVAANPSSPNKIYVGTVGHGIFRSINGGDTWEHIFPEISNYPSQLIQRIPQFYMLGVGAQECIKVLMELNHGYNMLMV
jgi:hypothetical protein